MNREKLARLREKPVIPLGAAAINKCQGCPLLQLCPKANVVEAPCPPPELIDDGGGVSYATELADDSQNVVMAKLRKLPEVPPVPKPAPKPPVLAPRPAAPAPPRQAVRPVKPRPQQRPVVQPELLVEGAADLIVCALGRVASASASGKKRV